MCDDQATGFLLFHAALILLLLFGAACAALNSKSAADIESLVAHETAHQWFYGLVGGGLLVCFAGWLATRSVVNQPPVLTLRSG